MTDIDITHELIYRNISSIATELAIIWLPPNDVGVIQTFPARDVSKDEYDDFNSTPLLLLGYVELALLEKIFNIIIVTTSRIDEIAGLTIEQRKTRIEQSIQLLFADLKIRIKNGEANLKELEQMVPVAPVTGAFLEIDEDPLLPLDEDVNS
ncbi:hypothetical protein HAX54_011882 [Datura stramonium]|uniref:Uncharacterized protein n=1 Tax=Datura stramonium TaxID=4076 RepID=A0ABS8TKT0_DATST|nr:hypothetical protein [Datura stramonium]